MEVKAPEIKENENLNIFKDMMKSSFLNDKSLDDRFYKKAFYEIEESGLESDTYINKVMDLEKIFTRQRDTVKKIILMEKFENIHIAQKEIKVGSVYFKI